MDRARAMGQVIPFPEPGRWSAIAAKYVDNMTRGDPRAAFYYLDYELAALKLSRPPPALQSAIDREYRRRGFRGPVRFDGPG
jgi:hypothetical protein